MRRINEIVSMTCDEEHEEAFELAILQLGYTILESTWDDENHIILYQVQKKWMKQPLEVAHG